MRAAVKLTDKLIKDSLATKNFKDYASYRTEAPLRPGRCRQLGYKSTPEYFTVITSKLCGGINAAHVSRGRTPSKLYRKFSRDISKFDICKNTLAKKYPNYKVLGGYEVYSNSKRVWYQFCFKKAEVPKLKNKKSISL